MARYLFVYGTLRKAYSSEMSRYLQSHARYVDQGSIQAKMFDVGGYPGVVLSADSRDIVIGDVFELSDEQTVLATLDAYEECSAGDPLPHEYTREKIIVSLGSNTTMSAWVYRYNYSVDTLSLIYRGTT